jgi:hypothetical protein
MREHPEEFPLLRGRNDILDSRGAFLPGLQTRSQGSDGRRELTFGRETCLFFETNNPGKSS